MPVSASRAWSRKTRSIRPSGAAAMSGPYWSRSVERGSGASVFRAVQRRPPSADRENEIRAGSGKAPALQAATTWPLDGAASATAGRRDRGPLVARGHDRDGGALLVLVVALEAHDDAAALAGDDARLAVAAAGGVGIEEHRHIEGRAPVRGPRELHLREPREARRLV